MSKPLSKGHHIEKVERWWHDDEQTMRYMVVHQEDCPRCVGRDTNDLYREFEAIQCESGEFVIMVRPLPDGRWEVW